MKKNLSALVVSLFLISTPVFGQQKDVSLNDFLAAIAEMDIKGKDAKVVVEVQKALISLAKENEALRKELNGCKEAAEPKEEVKK